MKIQQPISSINQQLNPKKSDEKESAVSSKPQVSEFKKPSDMISAANQQLFIGAKSLMASLNQELKFSGEFSSSFSFSQSLDSVSESTSILDKIDIEPISFDFEEVAKNVMEFVSGAIKGAKSGGASDEKLAQMLEQARAGVDMGFEMAREELGDMDMLNDDVSAGIDKSYDLIQTGLNGLDEELFGKAVSTNEQLISQNVMMSEQEQGSISIKTLDGDNINIKFSNDMSLQFGQGKQEGRMVSNMSFNNNSTFSFEVEGHLDEDELKAVSALVKDISELADNFFNGDIEKAWQQANELDFDKGEIAQYALDFKEVKQVAIKQSYQTSDNNGSPIAKLSPYIKDLNQVFDNAQTLFSGNNLKDLMTEIAQQQLDLMEGLVTKSAQGFTDFNQQIKDAQQV